MAVTALLEITTMTDEQAGKALNHNTAVEKLEQAIGKSYTLQIGNVATYDFSTAGNPGKADALAAYRINITSSATMTAICVFTFPAHTKPYLIRNNTTGGFSIKVKASGGTIETTIASGESAYLYCDASEFQKIGSVITAGASNPIFGDGSDGDATLVATASPWTRDMFYNRLLITGASTFIRTTNWRIFVKEYFQLNSTCTLHNDGNAASVTVGAVALATGSVGGTPVTGPNGGTAAGSAGTSVSGSGIGTPGTSAAGGGAGGAGLSGAGGAAGSRTSVTEVQGSLRYIDNAVNGRCISTTAFINVNTGATGGAGGGDGTAGGGGGGPAGYVMLCAQTLVNNGTISAIGGAGGSPAGGQRGGGGGGQGGIIVMVYQYLSGSGTTSVAGGAGGIKQGAAGVNGSAGVAGKVYTFIVQ